MTQRGRVRLDAGPRDVDHHEREAKAEVDPDTADSVRGLTAALSSPDALTVSALAATISAYGAWQTFESGSLLLPEQLLLHNWVIDLTARIGIS